MRPRVSKESKKSPKTDFRTLFRLFSDSFGTLFWRTLSGLWGSRPGGLFRDSFRTLSGSRAQRARETLSQRAKRSKKFALARNFQSRSKFLISIAFYNLDVSNSPQKIGPRWVARSKFSFSGKEKAHKHKQIFPVTARAGGGGLPTGGQGSKVYVLCAEPKEHKCFRPGTRPGGIGFPAGRIGDRGDREILYVPNVYVPFPAPTFSLETFNLARNFRTPQSAHHPLGHKSHDEHGQCNPGGGIHFAVLLGSDNSYTTPFEIPFLIRVFRGGGIWLVVP